MNRTAAYKAECDAEWPCFNHYEIRPTRQMQASGEPAWTELCDDEPELADAWSLYGREEGRGATCIGDFKDEAAACWVLSRILGVPVYGTGSLTIAEA